MEYVDQLLEFKSTFVWKAGETPLSDPAFVVASLVVYVCGSFLIQALMRGRAPLNVTYLVVIHNAGLCLASFAMFAGAIYEVYKVTSEHYADNVLGEVWCDSKKMLMAPSSGLPFWSYMYYLSKFWEMLDTVILALKKKDLTFLQMYHHTIIVLLCYSWLEASWSLHWWALVVNTLVHQFMYYYFSLSALGYNVWWKKVKTRLVNGFNLTLNSTLRPASWCSLDQSSF